MFKRIILKNKKGQALIETLLMIPLILFFFFVGVQLFFYVLNTLVSNNVTFKLNRVATVAGTKKVTDSLFMGTAFLTYITPLYGKAMLKGLYVPTGLKVYENDLGENKLGYTVFLTYGTRIFGAKFANIFPSKNRYLFNNYYKGVSKSRMVKSPEEHLYNKAYPNAKKFGKV